MSYPYVRHVQALIQSKLSIACSPVPPAAKEYLSSRGFKPSVNQPSPILEKILEMSIKPPTHQPVILSVIIVQILSVWSNMVLHVLRDPRPGNISQLGRSIEFRLRIS